VRSGEVKAQHVFDLDLVRSVRIHIISLDKKFQSVFLGNKFGILVAVVLFHITFWMPEHVPDHVFNNL
jgi:hypothetical protein